MKDDQLNTVEKITELIKPLLTEREYELVDIEYKNEGKSRLLRIYIDKPGGITIDDCAEISREFGTLLDVSDLIRTSYRLEVSSPGLRRPLKKPDDFTRFVGRKVKVKTYAPVNERKTFTGDLKGYHNGDVIVDVEGSLYNIPHDMISKANLEIDF